MEPEGTFSGSQLDQLEFHFKVYLFVYLLHSCVAHEIIISKFSQNKFSYRRWTCSLIGTPWVTQPVPSPTTMTRPPLSLITDSGPARFLWFIPLLSHETWWNFVLQYESDMKVSNYKGPSHVVAAFAELNLDKQMKILDLLAGSGVVGSLVRQLISISTWMKRERFKSY